mgnify:CR=1 FL=1
MTELISDELPVSQRREDIAAALRDWGPDVVHVSSGESYEVESGLSGSLTPEPSGGPRTSPRTVSPLARFPLASRTVQR